jgi:hypothetical protein
MRLSRVIKAVSKLRKDQGEARYFGRIIRRVLHRNGLQSMEVPDCRYNDECLFYILSAGLRIDSAFLEHQKSDIGQELGFACGRRVELLNHMDRFVVKVWRNSPNP